MLMKCVTRVHALAFISKLAVPLISVAEPYWVILNLNPLMVLNFKALHQTW